MKKEKFSIIIVPHDLQKTRTYKMSYSLFYLLVTFLAIGAVVLVIFVATYSRLLVRARESVMLARQIEELTAENEKVNELSRNLAELQSKNLIVRRMLGMDNAIEDSLTHSRSLQIETRDDREVESEKEHILRAAPSFWPVRGYITRGYSIAGGEGAEGYHPGIDIGVERGTPVRAAASGSVAEAGWDDTYGYFIRIDHGYGIKTLYGHNERLVVMVGERVGRGQTIAYSGNTGKSTAPHLHFEVTHNNVNVDPLSYLLK
jgi:murein DD-endopeptidase MepM/ murein hydrolase activator NlpD